MLDVDKMKINAMDKSTNKGEEEYYEYDYDMPLFHPAKVFITLMLASLTMIFLFLTLSYLYNRLEQDIPSVKVPLIFLFNTIILIVSSYMMHRANEAYQEDDTDKYKKSLLFTVACSLLFMILQIVGWYQLVEANASYFSSSDNAKSYLQLISGFHFIHVIVGLPFLAIFYNAAKKRMIEPVSVLVYFSDPEKRLKLKLLTVYWHFLDILWIYLVVFFFVNSLF